MTRLDGRYDVPRNNISWSDFKETQNARGGNTHVLAIEWIETCCDATRADHRTPVHIRVPLVLRARGVEGACGDDVTTGLHERAMGFC